MGAGAKIFCLGLPKTLFSSVNKPYFTYMRATSDNFGKFGPLAKSLKIIIFHAWSSQEAKMGQGLKVAPKCGAQYECWDQTLFSGTSDNTFPQVEQSIFDLYGSYDRYFWKIWTICEISQNHHFSCLGWLPELPGGENGPQK